MHASAGNALMRRGARLGFARIVGLVWRLVLVGVVVAAVGVPSGVGAQTKETFVASLAFSGSAAADGVQLTVTVPGGPLSDTPVNGGGPTAQVVVNSGGSSTGYAAFPAPGDLVLSAPGLVAGFLALGVGGLPPIDVPTLPHYPFFVHSDVFGTHEESVGSGPYELSASSRSGSSEASAKVGFQTGAAGNASLVTSTASLSSAEDGVVATAVSDLQSLYIGPLAVGQVKSVATMTLDPQGTVTPSTALEISALRIGGVAVRVTPEGLRLGETPIPVPINTTLDELLRTTGVSVRLLPAQEFPDRVVAPALEITMPFTTPAIPRVGEFSGGEIKGTATVRIGAATASLVGAAPSGLDSTEGGAGIGVGSESTLPGRGPGDEGALPPTAGAPLTGGSGVGSPSPFLIDSSPTSIDSSPTSIDSSPTMRSAEPGPRSLPIEQPLLPLSLVGLPGIHSLYLVVAGGSLAALGLGQLIRLLGVRRPWTSTVG